MNYDCVIATRNRKAALQMSIPLILNQDDIPNKLIIVDASDDHIDVSNNVKAICAAHDYHNAVIIKSDKANSARQRNIGLNEVTAPVVMFPDDNSMWHPAFAKNIISVYEANVNGKVGGVTGVSSRALPLDVLRPTYPPSHFARFRSAVQPLRNAVENFLVPKPFETFALTISDTNVSVVDGVNIKRVPTVGGYRMTFRTEVIKIVGFSEILGYGVGYSLHEDMDASLRVQIAGFALVSAENAKVHHYVFPGKRAKGFNYGFCHIANYAYVCKKNIPESSSVWNNVDKYLAYKLALYSLQSGSAFGRDMFRGAFAAY